MKWRSEKASDVLGHVGLLLGSHGAYEAKVCSTGGGYEAIIRLFSPNLEDKTYNSEHVKTFTSASLPQIISFAEEFMRGIQ